MATSDGQAWALLSLLSRTSEQIAALGGMPGTPLDTETWINRHIEMYTDEFVCDDWSAHQPALRKISLVALSSCASGAAGTREGRP